MNIAEPYCNWAIDEDAKHSPILLLRNITIVVAISAFIAIPVIGKITDNTEGAPPWFVAFFLTGFIGMIVSAMLQSKASTATIRCSACRQNMKHTQHNYPAKANSGLLAGAAVIQGGNGRQYMEQHVGKGSATQWCQVLQELRTCDKCKRYVVL